MAENNFSTALSGVKNSFNILKEWRKDNRKSYLHQANSLLQENQDELRRMDRRHEKDRGTDMTDIGASGIDKSSFNDALLAKDLENIREKDEKRRQANSEALELRKKASEEGRNRRDKAFSYSVGLLSDLNSLIF